MPIMIPPRDAINPRYGRFFVGLDGIEVLPGDVRFLEAEGWTVAGVSMFPKQPEPEAADYDDAGPEEEV